MPLIIKEQKFLLMPRLTAVGRRKQHSFWAHATASDLWPASVGCCGAPCRYFTVSCCTLTKESKFENSCHKPMCMYWACSHLAEGFARWPEQMSPARSWLEGRLELASFSFGSLLPLASSMFYWPILPALSYISSLNPVFVWSSACLALVAWKVRRVAHSHSPSMVSSSDGQMGPRTRLMRDFFFSLWR